MEGRGGGFWRGAIEKRNQKGERKVEGGIGVGVAKGEMEELMWPLMVGSGKHTVGLVELGKGLVSNGVELQENAEVSMLDTLPYFGNGDWEDCIN